MSEKTTETHDPRIDGLPQRVRDRMRYFFNRWTCGSGFPETITTRWRKDLWSGSGRVFMEIRTKTVKGNTYTYSDFLMDENEWMDAEDKDEYEDKTCYPYFADAAGVFFRHVCKNGVEFIGFPSEDMMLPLNEIDPRTNVTMENHHG